MPEQFYVYIMADKPRGSTYVGMTNDLVRRVYEHRENVLPKSHTSRYNLKQLVHYEVFHDPTTAINREKRLKDWVRDWKTKLIETGKPTWKDLWHTIAKP